MAEYQPVGAAALTDHGSSPPPRRRRAKSIEFAGRIDYPARSPAGYGQANQPAKRQRAALQGAESDQRPALQGAGSEQSPALQGAESNQREVLQGTQPNQPQPADCGQGAAESASAPVQGVPTAIRPIPRLHGEARPEIEPQSEQGENLDNLEILENLEKSIKKDAIVEEYEIFLCS